MNEEKSLSVQTSGGLLAPVASLGELKAAYQAKKDFIESVLKPGTDYGVIPGTGTKPTLLKAGAEKISTLYGLQTEFLLLDKVEDWVGDDHGGEPFFYYRYGCSLLKGGVVMANAEGSANSWEKKYRYRTADLVCPSCGQATIFRSKYPDEVTGELGWFCWAAKGGCGANFDAEHPEIVGQDRGMVPNPNPADTVNTLQKMAQKRAMVAAALIVGDVSDFFTQDLEDLSYGDAPVIEGSFVAPAPDPVPGPGPAANGDPGAVLVPFAKAKRLNGGDKPSVAWLWNADREYCEWIVANKPGDLADAIQAYASAIDSGDVVEGEPVRATGTPGLDAIIDAVVEAGLSENYFAAKSALEKCRTGYATPVAAVSWMRFYRGWRDLGKSPDGAAQLANAGHPPQAN